MINDPKKRAWFQIHLSTAIVLMFVAGGITWGNVTEEKWQWSDREMPNAEPTTCSAHGWPFYAIINFQTKSDPSHTARPKRQTRNMDTEMPTSYFGRPPQFALISSTTLDETGNTSSVAAGIVDFGIACAVLTFVWFMCEIGIQTTQKKDPVSN